MSEAFYPLLFLPVSLSFSLMLNARVSQLPAMTALSCAAFFLSWSLSRYAKLATLASFLSAIAIGCGGNLYSNATGKPALAATASGIFILVPGCFALRSIVSELGGQTGGSLGLSTAILTVAVSSARRGLAVAAGAAPPRLSPRPFHAQSVPASSCLLS